MSFIHVSAKPTPTEKTTGLPSTEPRKVNILCPCKSRSITPSPARLEQPTSNHHKLSTKPPQITTKNPPSHPEHRRTTTRFSPPRHPCSFSSSSSPLPLLLSFCFHPERSEGPRRSLPHPYRSSLFFNQNLHPLPLPQRPIIAAAHSSEPLERPNSHPNPPRFYRNLSTKNHKNTSPRKNLSTPKPTKPRANRGESRGVAVPLHPLYWIQRKKNAPSQSGLFHLNNQLTPLERRIYPQPIWNEYFADT